MMMKRSPAERKLLEKAEKYLPGGTLGNMGVRDDLLFLTKEGRGSRVWDVSGNEYVDWLMGSGPMVLGHAHPAVVEAVVKATERGSTFFATNEAAVLLAEELVKAVPAPSRCGLPPAARTLASRPCVLPEPTGSGTRY